MQLRISFALLLALGIGFATSRTSAPDAATTAPAADACTPDATLEAADFCLPRQCGRIPVCTANSVPVCSPDTGCHWICVPINGPA